MRHFWGILFAVVLAAAFVLTAVAPSVGWWLPRGVSSYSRDIDLLYYGILAVTAFFFVLTEAVLVYNMIRWAGDPARKAQFSHGNHRLEMLWTVIPGVILFLLAVIQINVWAEIKYPTHMAAMVESDPSHILPMEVTTRQWEYRVRYPSPERLALWADKATAVREYQARLPERRDDVFDVNHVHTWKGQKTVVFLRTRDVGHAFFVPVLRVKQDSMPGRTIPLWFDANESNTKKVGNEWRGGNGVNDPAYDWDLVCTQYCGSRHSMMRGKLFVHETKEDFLDWLRAQQREYSPPAGAAAE